MYVCMYASPSPSCFKEINDVISKFLWCGKPPKWKEEILEGEIPHGGLKLHDLKFFVKALKLSWLKRYQRSTSKWTIFPNNFELWEVFIYGPDILNKLREITSNKFWLDIIESLALLWKSEAMKEKSVIKNTPIWLNPTFSFPIKKQWFKKGITMVSDFLGVMNVVMPIDTFMETYGLKTNFLEYHFTQNNKVYRMERNAFVRGRPTQKWFFEYFPESNGKGSFKNLQSNEKNFIFTVRHSC